jgi:penicillin-binding protein 1A
MRASAGDTKVILEAFKPGQAPPDSYSVVGYTDQQGVPDAGPFNPNPDVDRAVKRGTGLY